MKLEKLIQDCQEAICEDIEQSILCGLSHACAYVSTKDGEIEIHSHRTDGLEVYVFHNDSEREHDSQRLEDYIENNILADWWGIEDAIEERSEYNDNGFCDSSDYWSYRL